MHYVNIAHGHKVGIKKDTPKHHLACQYSIGGLTPGNSCSGFQSTVMTSANEVISHDRETQQLALFKC